MLYAPEDFPFRREIEKQLKGMVRAGEVSITPHPPETKIGEDIEGYPEKYSWEAIKRAKIVLLLWSVNFISHDTITKLGEVVADLHHNGMIVAIPILCRQCLCDYSESLKRLRPLPKNGQSIEEQPEALKSTSYREIADNIYTILAIIKQQDTISRLEQENFLLKKKVNELQNNK